MFHLYDTVPGFSPAQEIFLDLNNHLGWHIGYFNPIFSILASANIWYPIIGQILTYTDISKRVHIPDFS